MMIQQCINYNAPSLKIKFNAMLMNKLYVLLNKSKCVSTDVCWWSKTTTERTMVARTMTAAWTITVEWTTTPLTMTTTPMSGTRLDAYGKMDVAGRLDPICRMELICRMHLISSICCNTKLAPWAKSMPQSFLIHLQHVWSLTPQWDYL